MVLDRKGCLGHSWFLEVVWDGASEAMWLKRKDNVRMSESSQVGNGAERAEK